MEKHPIDSQDGPFQKLCCACCWAHSLIRRAYQMPRQRHIWLHLWKAARAAGQGEVVLWVLGAQNEKPANATLRNVFFILFRRGSFSLLLTHRPPFGFGGCLSWISHTRGTRTNRVALGMGSLCEAIRTGCRTQRRTEAAKILALWMAQQYEY
jgi:hypothetical protein